jgi:predicted permease
MGAALAHAWRSWASARAVATLAIVAFAVGIGSATAIFTVVNGVLLKPLPYAAPERLVILFSASFSQPDQRGANVFPDLLQYEQRLRSFDAFGWFRPSSFTLTFDGQAQHVAGAAVTPSLVEVLGVQPMIGTWFTDDSGIVISYGLWRRLGAEAAIAGKPMSLDGRSYTIVGVMPPAFRLPVSGPGVEGIVADVWISLDPLGQGQNPREGFNFAYARLKPDVSFAQADADVKRVAAEIAALDPAGHPSYTARIDSLREAVILTIKPTLQLLAIAAGVLLLITCADVAGLLLTRSLARARETAIRVALGAGRRQLALHYFLEGLLVALAGAAAGVGVSILLVRAVVSLAADHIPRAGEIVVDRRVLLFALATAVLASLLASLAPLWQALRTAPSDVLNEGVRSSASVRSQRISRSLVVAELALAFVLLTVGGLLVGHLRSLGGVRPGFDPQNLLTFEMALREREKLDAIGRVQAHERLTSAIERIPGVTSAAFSNQLPLAGCCFSTTIYPEGRTVRAEEIERTNFVTITPGYFRTMAVPLVSGRFLDARDIADDALRVVVNEAAVRVNWPTQNPIGAYGRLASPEGSRFQIVGVVGDIRNDALGKPTVPAIYVLSAIVPLQPIHFAVRSTLPPQALIPEIRRAIAEIDPAQPIYKIATMTQVVESSIALPRVGSFMTGFFAIAALLMATLGIYGVVSYSVRQATVEIGTRMALGAVGRDLLRMVVGDGLKMAAYGAAIGGIVVVGAAWLIVRLFDIQHLSVLPFVSSAALIAAVAATASFFPAWRATTLSPMLAIRNEPGSAWRLTKESLGEAFKGVSRAMSTGEPPESRVDIVSDLAAAARGAGSYREAFDRALATLRAHLRAASATLLEKSGDEYRQIAASVPEGDAGHSTSMTLPSEGFLVKRLRWYAHPLPFTPGDLTWWTAWADGRSPAEASEVRALTAAGLRMAIALRARDEIVGILLLGEPRERSAYDEADRRALRQCADQLTMMIENARLTVRVVEQEKLRRDVALAAEVQKRLLPERPPQPASAALAAVSLPARSVGGDYYDFLELGDQRIGIALADVAGKGVAAALIMAVVQASLRIVAADGTTSLPELAAKINGFLHRATQSNSYATFFYAQLDERSRQLRYVNAGHNPPYLIRSIAPSQEGGSDDAEIRELNVGGTVLGLFPQMTYEEATVDLRPGDVLVAFTDGVTEALNAAEEEFGETRLKDLLRHVIDLPAAEISARIAEELRTWIRATDQYDDLTFIVMKVQ